MVKIENVPQIRSRRSGEKDVKAALKGDFLFAQKNFFIGSGEKPRKSLIVDIKTGERDRQNLEGTIQVGQSQMVPPPPPQCWGRG